MSGLAQTSQRANNLREVVVWGNRSMKDIGVQKTTFDSLSLKENIALSMADILTFNSSVFVKSYGRATLSTVAFRGTSPSHTQVTWNGMRINNPMLGMTDFSTIPSFFIDKASLLHGTSSVNETGGGLGGLVRLGTAPDVEKGINMQYVQESVLSTPSTNSCASPMAVTVGTFRPGWYIPRRLTTTNIKTTTRR